MHKSHSPDVGARAAMKVQLLIFCSVLSRWLIGLDYNFKNQKAYHKISSKA